MAHVCQKFALRAIRLFRFAFGCIQCVFGLFPIGDITYKGTEADRIVHFHRNNGQLDQNFPSVPVNSGQFNSSIEIPTLARGTEA